MIYIILPILVSLFWAEGRGNLTIFIIYKNYMNISVANKIKLPLYINFPKIVSAFESAINNLTTNSRKSHSMSM